MTDTRDLVKRLLDTPDIARLVPRLPSAVLHRVIERTGLEAAGEIVALATPGQLRRLLDIDLWRAPAPGADETLDADRFGEWLEVLLQLGSSVAAERLAAMDVDLVVGGLSSHVDVFDGAAVSGYVSLDGDLVEGRSFGDRPVREIGGFVVAARPRRAWDAVVELLVCVHAERPGLFNRVMRECVAVSDGEREIDGCADLLDDRDQQMTDLTNDRDTRRDRAGYVAPAQARAFLVAARHLDLDGQQPPADAVARAYLRDFPAEAVIEEDEPGAGASAAGGVLSADAVSMGAVMEILTEAGVVKPPRALLTGETSEDTRLDRVRAFVASRLQAQEELAFLANAMLSGCALQERSLTPDEASDLVLATCNLGLENWPPSWHSADLVTAFGVGWALLHREVSMSAARALADVLGDLHCDDRDVQWSLQTLRRELIRCSQDGEPWRARGALEALLMLDAVAWAVLRAFLDECPTLHTAVVTRGSLSVDPASVRFVAANTDIAAARGWLAGLMSALAG